MSRLDSAARYMLRKYPDYYTSGRVYEVGGYRAQFSDYRTVYALSVDSPYKDKKDQNVRVDFGKDPEDDSRCRYIQLESTIKGDRLYGYDERGIAPQSFDELLSYMAKSNWPKLASFNQSAVYPLAKQMYDEFVERAFVGPKHHEIHRDIGGFEEALEADKVLMRCLNRR